MPEFLQGLPVGAVLAILFGIAMLRGQAMYWIGRVATEQTLRRTAPNGEVTDRWWARIHRWLSAGGADAGIAAVRRWGLLAVPFSYLTIGLQSLIQIAAGVLRIQWWRYLLAQVPGACAWAGIYGTFGFVTWAIVGAALAGNPWAAVGLVVLAVVLMLVLARIGRRASTALASGDDLSDR